jgi:hypothetical protein
MSTKALVVAAMVGVLLTGAAATAQPLTPHIPGWARYFEVTWEPFQQRGQPRLGGHVVSKWGETATGVRLLVEALDAEGKIVGQRVEWLAGTVPPFSRAYFEVPVPAPAASYRVSVFTFDFPQAARVEAP